VLVPNDGLLNDRVSLENRVVKSLLIKQNDKLRVIKVFTQLSLGQLLASSARLRIAADIVDVQND
jgi:hypothetical protein